MQDNVLGTGMPNSGVVARGPAAGKRSAGGAAGVDFTIRDFNSFCDAWPTNEARVIDCQEFTTTQRIGARAIPEADCDFTSAVMSVRAAVFGMLPSSALNSTTTSMRCSTGMYAKLSKAECVHAR